MTSRDDKRLARLAGSGEGWGGGLPLPLLCAAILHELLDNETMTDERAATLSAELLPFKSQQIITNQAMGAPRATAPDWEGFAADVLTQMEDQGIVRRGGEQWRTGPGFDTGVPLIIIPSGDGRPADSVTVWPREERETRDRAAYVIGEALSQLATLRRGRSLRTTGKPRLDALRESIATFGDHSKDFPVLQDQDGTLLDGYHRLAINPKWPARTTHAATDEERAQKTLV